MFKFNFVEDDTEDQKGDAGREGSEPGHAGNTIRQQCREIASEQKINSRKLHDRCCLERLSLSEDLEILKRIGVVSQAHEKSDIIPGEYEGGFKVWECSIDLAMYIAQEKKVKSIFRGDGNQEHPAQMARVIELGCGQGLPGIAALRQGAEVHFQDHDEDVLTDLTIPVVEANIEEDMGEKRGKIARYFCGDWGSMAELLEKLHLLGTYDLVLTSETIYSMHSIPRLLDCILKCLKSPTGFCLLAAKSFYFGVGGGIAAFKKLVQEDGRLTCTTIKVIDDGLSNKREILHLAFSNKEN